MSGPVVFDTNAISYVIRDDPRGELVRDLIVDHDATISFQTYQELWRGVFKADWSGPRQERLHAFLATFEIQHSNEALALRCAQLRADQERRGNPLSIADSWIAATALVLDCPLVTNDRGFQRAQVPGLVVRGIGNGGV